MIRWLRELVSYDENGSIIYGGAGATIEPVNPVVQFSIDEMHEMSAALSGVSLLPPEDIEILSVIIKATHEGVFSLSELTELLETVVRLSNQGVTLEYMIVVLREHYG